MAFALLSPQGGEYVDSLLLCHAVLYVRHLATFQRNQLPLSAAQICKTQGSTKMSLYNYKITRCHILENAYLNIYTILHDHPS